MNRHCLALTLLSAAAPAWANVALRCNGTAEPSLVRSEGVSETVGTIVLTCTALTAAAGDVRVALSVTMPTGIGNRMAADGTVDASLDVDKGSGAEVTAAAARAAGTNTVTFDAISFPLPVSRSVSFRIRGLRGGGGNSEGQLTAFLYNQLGSSLVIDNNPVRLGIARRSLAAAGVPARIECRASAAVTELTFTNIMSAGVKATTMRITEPNLNSFERRAIGSTNGTRIVIKYSAFPPGAHVFVPNLIAGNSASSPTSAGDFGAAPGGGSVDLSVGPALVLARVPLADANGSGGDPVIPAGVSFSQPLTFEEMHEVTLVNGAASVTYEVVSADDNRNESAQIPTFVCVPEGAQEGAIATATLSLGPVSTQPGASATAPVPRYAALPPARDCDIHDDCEQVYGPRLAVQTPPLSYSLPQGSPKVETKLSISNAGLGTLSWKVVVKYPDDAASKSWLNLSAESGADSATVLVTLDPAGLAPGFHSLILCVDAGPAGLREFPVTLEITAGGTGETQGPPARTSKPRMSAVGNSADLALAHLIPGSLATIAGSDLRGRAVITVNGAPSQILYSNSERIHFVAPESALGLNEARLRLTIDGEQVADQPVRVARMSPAIFPGGVLNQDGSAHGEAKPEKAGRILQIFAAGLPLPSTGRMIAKIHDREIHLPVWAGDAPDLPGIQQLNVRIPDDLRPMDTNLWVCGVPVTDTTSRACSPPVRIRIAPE